MAYLGKTYVDIYGCCKLLFQQHIRRIVFHQRQPFASRSWIVFAILLHSFGCKHSIFQSCSICKPLSKLNENIEIICNVLIYSNLHFYSFALVIQIQYLDKSLLHNLVLLQVLRYNSCLLRWLVSSHTLILLGFHCHSFCCTDSKR